METNEYLLHSIHELAIKIETMVSKMEVKAFYTVEEFALLTGLSNSTIRTYCINGLLEATQAWTVENSADVKRQRNGLWLIAASEFDRLRANSKANLIDTNSNKTLKCKTQAT
jgi:hypothetical protein